MLSDKIIALRRKNGWSQEELADQLDISRQAVSKWESAQSMPDVDRIVQLADLFNVSTDYLLRDGEAAPAAEAEVPVKAAAEPAARRVSMEEAKDFLEISWSNSLKIAVGVLLCVLSPVWLILLSGLADADRLPECEAVAFGMIALLGLVAAAVTLFVLAGFKNQKYEYLEKEHICLDSLACEMTKKRREEYRSCYVRLNTLAACLCVLSPVPIFMSMLGSGDDATAFTVCCTLVFAGVAAALFTLGGVKWGAIQKLLQEGDYTPFEKRANVLREKVAPIYWIAVTAVYLAWSFAGGEWGETWILWPVAGVIFAGICVICGMIQKNREEKA